MPRDKRVAAAPRCHQRGARPAPAARPAGHHGVEPLEIYSAIVAVMASGGPISDASPPSTSIAVAGDLHVGLVQEPGSISTAAALERVRSAVIGKSSRALGTDQARAG